MASLVQKSTTKFLILKFVVDFCTFRRRILHESTTDSGICRGMWWILAVEPHRRCKLGDGVLGLLKFVRFLSSPLICNEKLNSQPAVTPQESQQPQSPQK
ncbi:hypothetical protein cgp_3326 [Corynebacterium glutamicum MB001]|nr:hypothetical protein cgp_3326 [Corynebacterium glutamicum MB001]ASW15294.1 hypothetical protein cgc1_3326 [Corynebacterium glutamicum]QYO74956.1 hypothetical protein cgisf_3326 [Corynebacterium glutamicum]CAF18939.1 hypothetical protein predicted by Glimmer [Corynebacterium glutamicum ATCC 13032]